MTKDKKQDDIDKIFKPMTDHEIKKLAQDMYLGLVFTDRNIMNKDDVPRVFMPLALMEEELAEELRKKSPGMLYEYLDKASPLAMDGMPIFFSFKMVSSEDSKKVLEKYNNIIEAVAKV